MSSDVTGETPRLYQQMAGQLSELIESGQFGPGTRLPAERELMKQFDVSRSVVREALIVLQLDGLVDIKQGAGTFVTERPKPQNGAVSGFTFDSTGPFDLIRARIHIEGETAALAALAASPQELAAIREAVRQMVEDREPYMLRHSSDKAFHTAVARASHNAAYATMVAAMWERYSRLIAKDAISERARHPDNFKRAIADHTGILNCIENKDPAGARIAMRNHLERVSWFFSTHRPDEEPAAERTATP